jgi:hypothetical protein
VIWHPFNRETAPKDRPIAILSIHPRYGGGQLITMKVSQWREGYDDGYRFQGGTHWCEVSDLELPK